MPGNLLIQYSEKSRFESGVFCKFMLINYVNWLARLGNVVNFRHYFGHAIMTTKKHNIEARARRERRRPPAQPANRRARGRAQGHAARPA